MSATTLTQGMEIRVACPIETEGKTPLSERQTVLLRHVTKLNPETPEIFEFEEGTLKISRMGIDWDLPAAAPPVVQPEKPRRRRRVQVEVQREPWSRVIYWADGARREGLLVKIEGETVMVDNGTTIVGLRAGDCGQCWAWGDDPQAETYKLGPGYLRVLGPSAGRPHQTQIPIAPANDQLVTAHGLVDAKPAKPPRKKRTARKPAQEEKTAGELLLEAQDRIYNYARAEADVMGPLRESDWTGLRYQAEDLWRTVKVRDVTAAARILEVLAVTSATWALRLRKMVASHE